RAGVFAVLDLHRGQSPAGMVYLLRDLTGHHLVDQPGCGCVVCDPVSRKQKASFDGRDLSKQVAWQPMLNVELHCVWIVAHRFNYHSLSPEETAAEPILRPLGSG